MKKEQNGDVVSSANLVCAVKLNINERDERICEILDSVSCSVSECAPQNNEAVPSGMSKAQVPMWLHV